MNDKKHNSVKDDIIAYLHTLPEDVSLDKIIYHLTVKQKILKGLDDIKRGRTYSHEEVKKLMEKKLRSMEREEEMDVETMLNECCKMRGNPTMLIHRTMHEFDWFYQNLVFDKPKIIKGELFEVTDSDLIEQISRRRIPQDEDLT